MKTFEQQFEEITNPETWVRVIRNIHNPEMIGKEYLVENMDRYGAVIVLNEKKENYSFDRSDVQFLTPLEYKGKKIGIGDELFWEYMWLKVYGYYWYDGKYKLLAVKDNNFESGCYSFYLYEITDLRPLVPLKHSQEEIEKAKKLLEEAGVLVEGKVIKN